MNANISQQLYYTKYSTWYFHKPQSISLNWIIQILNVKFVQVSAIVEGQLHLSARKAKKKSS